MTKRMSDDERMEARDQARGRADDKFLDAVERAYDMALPLVGHLQRAAGIVFYINVKSLAGRFTGRIKEFASEGAAVDYLIRNRYI